MSQGAAEFRFGLVEMSRSLLGNARFDENTYVVGIVGKALFEICDTPLEKPRLAICNLEISARNTHPLIECKRA